MPRIFDNLEAASSLLPALRETLTLSSRADFCVGYFNLRGWGGLAPYVDDWDPGDGPCRVLIGMQRLPHEELRESLSLIDRPSGVDNQTAHRLRVQLAEQLRQQLTIGAPTNADELTLRQLAVQLRAKKVVIKLFLRHPLHAKLYLLFRDDPVNPIVGYLGSSNLTFAGLAGQGELNVDVLDHDAALKLKKWFEDRWNDRFCVDITDELLGIIEESWAREALIPPYHVYLKMAYHLSHEARAGLAEFRIPKVFGDRLFDFQAAAVKIAAHHLNKRDGVLIGDVVGLGKTLMATAVAPHLRGRLRTGDADYLSQEPRAHVGRLRVRVPASGQGTVAQQGAWRVAQPAPLPAGGHRREPQSPQPRGQTLPCHPGVRPRQRQQVHPPIGHSV